MKALYKFSFSIFVMIYLSSCVSQSGNDMKSIKEMETKLAATRQDVKLAAQLDAAYHTYIRKYPEDTILPHMLFEDAQISIYPLNKMDAAIDQLTIIYTKYPNSRYAPNALFKSAYLNEKTQRFDKAKSLYLLFVQTYPNNELASQAKILASMTGLTEDEQLKQVLEKRNLIQDSIRNQKKVQK